MLSGDRHTLPSDSKVDLELGGCLHQDSTSCRRSISYWEKNHAKNVHGHHTARNSGWKYQPNATCGRKRHRYVRRWRGDGRGTLPMMNDWTCGRSEERKEEETERRAGGRWQLWQPQASSTPSTSELNLNLTIGRPVPDLSLLYPAFLCVSVYNEHTFSIRGRKICNVSRLYPFTNRPVFTGCESELKQAIHNELLLYTRWPSNEKRLPGFTIHTVDSLLLRRQQGLEVIFSWHCDVHILKHVL